jgi:hypothetical protein
LFLAVDLTFPQNVKFKPKLKRTHESSVLVISDNDDDSNNNLRKKESRPAADARRPKKTVVPTSTRSTSLKPDEPIAQ